MELQRGVCSLCSENTRVLIPSDVENYSKFLPEILYENFLTESEFQKIKKLLKICAICCYKIQAATETKNLFHSNKENEEIAIKSDVCRFCKTDRNVMKVENNWKYFLDRTEGYLTTYDFPVSVCPRCVFYFDVIYNMKSKLIYKFPQLAQQHPKRKHDTPNKQNDTPKRKSLSKSPPSSKKRKIFDNCFTYLQPLCNNNYHVDPVLKRDKRLYKKIAYVNLKNSKDVTVRETPKTRPIIKIKLKPRKESHVYVKVSKSEEPPNRSGHHKSKSRRHSNIEQKVSEEEQVDETPKAAATALVPKRRVSLYIDNGEKQEPEAEVKDDEINKIVDKYINESEDDDKSKGQEGVDEAIDENGVEKIDSDVRQEEVPQTEELTNGENSENVPENTASEEEATAAVEDSSSSDSSIASHQETPVGSEKWKNGSEGSDSDDSDKNKVKETDSLNGSERKKKRVTFSDEIV